MTTILCKDPRMRQIDSILSTNYFYTRQLLCLLLHSIFIMQRSSHETDSFHHLFFTRINRYGKIPARDRFDQLCTLVSHYYCTVFLLCKDPCTRQIHSLFLHKSIVMQRSPHKTDSTSYIHASVITVLLHSITRQIHSSTILFYTRQSLCKDPRTRSYATYYNYCTSLGKLSFSFYCDFDGGSYATYYKYCTSLGKLSFSFYCDFDGGS